jgi:hypothetical protein
LPPPPDLLRPEVQNIANGHHDLVAKRSHCRQEKAPPATAGPVDYRIHWKERRHRTVSHERSIAAWRPRLDNDGPLALRCLGLQQPPGRRSRSGLLASAFVLSSPHRRCRRPLLTGKYVPVDEAFGGPGETCARCRYWIARLSWQSSWFAAAAGSSSMTTLTRTGPRSSSTHMQDKP